MAKLIRLPSCGEWVDPERVSSVTVEELPNTCITGETRVVVRTMDGAAITVCTGEDVAPICEQVAKLINETVPRR